MTDNAPPPFTGTAEAGAADPRRVRRFAYAILGGLAVFIAAVALWKAFQVQREAAHRAQEASAGPFVIVSPAQMSPPERTLSLLGEAKPYAEATLFAKVSGYLKAVSVDKGDEVTAGQLIATIESPETEQAYLAARADAVNKQRVAERTRELARQNLVSEQEADQAYANADMAAATLRQQEVMRGYQTIRAPFSGIVTARFADPGALIQAATNSQTTTLPIVTVSQTDRLRIYVYVAQRDAATIELGQPASLQLVERPDLKLLGTVSRAAGQLDARTKTLLVEINFDNRARQIISGSFIQVGLTVRVPSYPEVPAEALVFRQGKPYVAVVGDDLLLSFRPVQIADNDGIRVRLAGGLQSGDRVALSVDPGLAPDTRVQIAQAAAAAPGSAAAPAPGSPAASGKPPVASGKSDGPTHAPAALAPSSAPATAPTGRPPVR
jgi:RND family efflux transporter MFP subunit